MIVECSFLPSVDDRIVLLPPPQRAAEIYGLDLRKGMDFDLITPDVCVAMRVVGPTHAQAN